MRRSLLCLCLVSLGLLSLAGGCGGGPKPIAVSGVVRWEDGKPVVGASVRFVPASGGREATGFTGKEGDFVLATYSSGDGAMAGEYTVVITKTETYTPEAPLAPGKGSPEDLAKAMKAFALKGEGQKKKLEDPVPAVYGDVKSSPIKQKIDSSTGKIEIKLKKI